MYISTRDPNLSFDRVMKNFRISGKCVAFVTEIDIKNEKTEQSRKFKLSHSTGSEWDPTTEWIYKAECGLTLTVLNDSVTKEMADNYLKAKLNK